MKNKEYIFIHDLTSHQVNTGSSIQALDNGGDSLDAQFGTNPRSISLPDRPYRNPNSYDSSSDMRKAERSQQQLSKPKVTSTRYSSPARPSYKNGKMAPYYYIHFMSVFSFSYLSR